MLQRFATTFLVAMARQRPHPLAPDSGRPDPIWTQNLTSLGVSLGPGYMPYGPLNRFLKPFLTDF